MKIKRSDIDANCNVNEVDITAFLILMELRTGDDYWPGYNGLAWLIDRPVKSCKKAMKKLKDAGYVVHEPTINADGIPNGSGFFLTAKGLHSNINSEVG